MSVFAIIIVVLAIILGVFLVLFVRHGSANTLEKMMSQQIKASKNMLEKNKDSLIEISSAMQEISAKSRERALNDNEEILKDIQDKEANIEKDAIKTKAKAVGEGLSEGLKDNNVFDSKMIFCKHCGASIDEDSLFCKNCGKKQ